MLPFQKVAQATEALAQYKVVGISADDYDVTTWRIDFAADATDQQKTDAQAALLAGNWGS